MKNISLMLIVLVLGLIVDLQTKVWAWDYLRGQPSVMLFDPIVELSFTVNTGMMWGWFAGVESMRPFIIFFPILSMVFMAFLIWWWPPKKMFAWVLIGVTLSGMLGNLYGKIFQQGVVDFIRVNYPWGGHWPIFNLADIFICIGIFAVLGWREE